MSKLAAQKRPGEDLRGEATNHEPPRKRVHVKQHFTPQQSRAMRLAGRDFRAPTATEMDLLENVDDAGSGASVMASTVSNSLNSEQEFQSESSLSASKADALFGMQLDELVRGSRVDLEGAESLGKRVIEPLLHCVRETLVALDDNENRPSAATVLQEFVSSPALSFLRSKPTDVAEFKFAAPSSVNVVGSFLSHTMTRTDRGIFVDVAATMPSSCFRKRDLKSFRYFDKRAVYVAQLVSRLRAGLRKAERSPLLATAMKFFPAKESPKSGSTKKSGKSSKKSRLDHNVDASCRIDFAPLRPGHDFRPVVEITFGASRKASSSLPPITVRVLPMLSVETFNLARLLPDRSHHNDLVYEHTGRLNKSENLLADGDESDDEKNDENESGRTSGTPRYNGMITEDTRLRRHAALMHAAVQACGDAFRDAAVLGSVWIRRRGLGRRAQFGLEPQVGCSGFAWSALLLWLWQRQLVRPGMTRVQILRVTWHFIAEGGLRLKAPETRSRAASFVAQIHDSSCPSSSLQDTANALWQGCEYEYVSLLSDGAGCNLFADLSREVVDELESDALFACRVLDVENNCVEAFQRYQHLFVAQPSFTSKCDSLIHITVDGKSAVQENTALSYVCSTLRRAYGDRIFRLFVRDSPAPPATGQRQFIVGLLVNHERALSIVDRGPPADTGGDAAAASLYSGFMEFWGPKLAQQRRFRDGAIVGAVVWSVPDDERFTVIRLIAEHILRRHCRISRKHKDTHMQWIGEDFSRILPHGMGELEHATFITTWELLAKMLRQLEGLPLSIQSFSPISAGFRGMPDAPYLSRAALKLHDGEGVRKVIVAPIHRAVIHFESSNAWPDDIEAIQHLKVAFYCALAAAIRKQFPKDHGVKAGCRPTKLGLELHFDGYSFLFTCHHPRESALLLRSESDLQNKAGYELQRIGLHMPRHHSALRNIQARHPLFPRVVQLAWQWICSHLLGDSDCERSVDSALLPREAVELLVASLFTAPAPHEKPPGSSHSGMVRFLERLGSFQFEDSPFVVDLGVDNNDNESVQMSEIQRQFREASRRIAPEELERIDEEFSRLRGSSMRGRGALPTRALYLASRMDPSSTFWTVNSPSPASLARLQVLARDARDFLESQWSTVGYPDSTGTAIFAPPLDHCDALIHLRPHSVNHYVEIEAQVAKSEVGRFFSSDAPAAAWLPGFDAALSLVRDLRRCHGHIAEFRLNPTGYDPTCHGIKSDSLFTNVVTVVWKPRALEPREARAHEVFVSEPTPASANFTQASLDVASVAAHWRQLGAGLIKRIDLLSSPSSSTE